jgi:hypothetical protein
MGLSSETDDNLMISRGEDLLISRGKDDSLLISRGKDDNPMISRGSPREITGVISSSDNDGFISRGEL